MIIYQDKKVTPKVYAKHQVSDHLMELFNSPEKFMDENFKNATSKEQEEILRHVSLFEDRVHKALGVKFKEIISTTSFTKSI
jgi:hypothetical protein